MRWLIVLDGTERSNAAAAYAAGLVREDEDEVLLLATGDEEVAADLSRSLAVVRPLFAGTVLQEINQPGELPRSVEKTAQAERADLVVYGSRGRTGWRRFLLGSMAARLEQRLSCSLLVVRGEVRPVRSVLIATTLFSAQSRALDLGRLFARRTGARATVLHVMSQIHITDGTSEATIEMTAEEAIARGTREGEILVQQLAQLSADGVPAEARLRHGLVLDEVVAELQEGGYDLLVIGAHRLPVDLPFGSLLAADVADEILMNTRSHLLIA